MTTLIFINKFAIAFEEWSILDINFRVGFLKWMSRVGFRSGCFEGPTQIQVICRASGALDGPW